MKSAYIGSSANPGFRDFAIAATIVRGHEVHDRVSFDINPSSRHILQTLADNGYLTELIAAGARTHQPGCNGCIGMGQAPAAGRISLRTVPRNFPGKGRDRKGRDDHLAPYSLETPDRRSNGGWRNQLAQTPKLANGR